MDSLITFLNTTGKTLVDFSTPMLIQSSVLIAVLLVIDLLARKKVRAVFRYCIWMLVLVKLLLPTTLSSPTGLGYWFGDKISGIVSEKPLVTEQTAPMLPGIESVSETVPPETAITILPQISTAHEPIAKIPAEPAIASLPATVSLSWQGFAFLGWLAAAGAMVLLLIQRMFFVRELLAQSKDPDNSMVDIFKQCQKQMKVRGQVNLRLSPVAGSPSVCGLFRPTILIPQNLPDKLNPQHLRSILLHELAHIKRGDLPVSLAQTILQIAYFYNPLLWLANAIIRKVREQAVDEMVLVAMGEKAEGYPETLLNISRLTFSRPALSLRLIGVVESKKALSGRIKHILSRPFPKSAKLGLLGLLTIILTAAILLPMAKAASKPPEFVIKGKVIDAKTGQPIAGAKVGDVEKYAEGKQCTTTDSNGNYEYKTWYEEHGVKAEADGYRRQDKGFGTKLFGSEKEKVIDFELTPEKAAEYTEATENTQRVDETVDDLRNLLMERKDILQKTLQTLEQKSKAGLVDSKELQQAKIDLLQVESQLAESPQKRNEILEQIVAIYKEQEKRTHLSLDAGRTTQDELDKAKLQRLDAEAALSKAKTEHAIVEAAFTPPDFGSFFARLLPNGVTVELVGVSGHPDKKSWRPDGSELKHQMYVKRERDYKDGKYGFIVKVDGPEDLSFSWNKIKGSGGWWGSCTVLDDRGDTVEGFEATVIKECDGRETTDIRIGIAAGPWETIAAHSGRGMCMTKGIAFASPYESGDAVRIVVTDSLGNEVVQRVVAIDENGNIHPCKGTSGSVSNQNLRQTTANFPGLKLYDIKEFQFQTRPYDWVEFKNISLKPNFKTDVQMEVEKSNQNKGVELKNKRGRLEQWEEQMEEWGQDMEQWGGTFQQTSIPPMPPIPAMPKMPAIPSMPMFRDTIQSEEKPKGATMLRIEVEESTGAGEDEIENEIALSIPLASLKAGNIILPKAAKNQMNKYGITIEQIIKMIEDGTAPMVLLEVGEDIKGESGEILHIEMRISLR